jgi:hypothetical protein
MVYTRTPVFQGGRNASNENQSITLIESIAAVDGSERIFGGIVRAAPRKLMHMHPSNATGSQANGR